MRKIKNIETKAQKKARKIINKISGVIIFLMFLVGYNTIGGLELGKVSLEQGQRTISLAVVMIIFNVAVFLLTRGDE